MGIAHWTEPHLEQIHSCKRDTTFNGSIFYFFLFWWSTQSIFYENVHKFWVFSILKPPVHTLVLWPRCVQHYVSGKDWTRPITYRASELGCPEDNPSCNLAVSWSYECLIEAHATLLPWRSLSSPGAGPLVWIQRRELWEHRAPSHQTGWRLPSYAPWWAASWLRPRCLSTAPAKQIFLIDWPTTTLIIGVSSSP